MKFAFNEEQIQIRETAAAFLKQQSSSATVRRLMETPLGYDKDQWLSLCHDMYWQAAHIPEAYGGLGLSYVELVCFAEEMGRHLYGGPFFSSVCLATNMLLLAADEAQKHNYLAQIVAGRTASLAYTSTKASGFAGQWHDDAIDATYQACDEGYEINGHYAYVVDGHSAELLILVAKCDADIGIFICDGDVMGLSRELTPTMDQTRKLAKLHANKVILKAEAKLPAGNLTNLNKVIDLAMIALAAEQLGGAETCLEMAVDYTQERRQFNRSIASFQATKHKAADMMCRVESARSGVYYAACIASEALTNASSEADVLLAEAAAISKSYCSDTYFKNAAENLQMHGGVGFTWEYDVHLHFKRAKQSEHLLGNGDYHRERLATLILSDDGLIPA